MRGDIQPLLLELFVLIGLFGNDDRHFHLVHVLQNLRQFVPLRLRIGSVALLHDLLLLNRPVMLYLVVHLHRRIFIDGDDHTFAEEAPAWEVVGNILGDLINAILPFDDLQDTGRGVFQQPGLVLVQVFLLDDVHHIVIQEVVLQTDLRDTAGIEQRHRGAVLHRLGEVILRHIVSEPLVGQALAAQQRSASKGDVVGIGQRRAHVLRQILILGPVRFIHQHDDIVPGGEHRVLFTLVIAELMDQGENEGFVGLQIVPQLLTVLRLAFLFLPDHFRLYKILVDLVIQVFAVGDDQEREIARDLAPNLAGEEHHGKGFAGALGVPEHAKLALQLRPVLYRFHQIVHTEILVVFGDDLVLLVAEHDEVFNVIHQSIFLQQAVDEIPDRAFAHRTGFLQRLTVGPFLLGVHLQPLEEMIVGGVEGTEPRLQPVGQHTDLVEGEQVRDIPQIVLQVVVIGFLHLDDAVFQLDKHHGQTIDED